MNCDICGEPLNALHIVDGCPRPPRTRDDIIEQAAQVLSTLTTCDGQPHATELHRRQANALADAGLLARPLPDRQELADELSGWPIGDGYYQTSVATAEARDMADAVIALLKGQDR